jgi:hypothetical protein
VEEWGLFNFCLGREEGDYEASRTMYWTSGWFFAHGEMATEYQKVRTGSNFRLHLIIVLFGSWFNLKMYF